SAADGALLAFGGVASPTADAGGRPDGVVEGAAGNACPRTTGDVVRPRAHGRVLSAGDQVVGAALVVELPRPARLEAFRLAVDRELEGIGFAFRAPRALRFEIVRVLAAQAVVADHDVAFIHANRSREPPSRRRRGADATQPRAQP